MKKWLLISIGVLSINTIQSQCAMGVSYPYTFDTSGLFIGSRTEVICCLWGNEYVSMSNIVAGNTYTFDSCGATVNVMLTLFDANNNTVAFNDNSCTSGGGSISSFTALASGVYKAQVNTSGCGGVNNNTPVYITLESTLGVQENNPETKTQLFPNPVTDHFSIETHHPIQEITLYDLQGKVVKSFKKPMTSYNVEQMAPGRYFVSIKSTTGTITKKLIKQ